MNDETIMETHEKLVRYVDQLGHMLREYLVPTPGFSRTVDGVSRQLDDVIDICVDIIDKVYDFEEVRTGNTTMRVV